MITAQLALARKLSVGRDCHRDLAQAYAWFSIAADQIARSKNALKEDMTPAQAADAELRVREWHHQSRAGGISAHEPGMIDHRNDGNDRRPVSTARSPLVAGNNVG